MKGQFVMVDGLDASGKGVIVDGLVQWAERQALKVLDLKEYCLEHHTFPEPEELDEYDVIRSDEPTYSFVGLGIRDELIKKNNRPYSGLTIAQAFALDREILYTRVLIPAIKAGKTVFQERGVTTSLVYQPLQDRLAISDLLHLPGNKLALQNAPTMLLITKVDPEVGIQRIKVRIKQDDHIFENLLFQRKVAERYNSSWLQKIFEMRGSKVRYIDTNPPKTPSDTVKEAIEIFENTIALKKI